MVHFTDIGSYGTERKQRDRIGLHTERTGESNPEPEDEELSTELQKHKRGL